MRPTVEEQIKGIKRALPSMMNGVAAKSMRDKGINYPVNWGVALTDLQQMAQQYTQDSALAIALWKDGSRECRIMALLLMPREMMKKDIAELWITQLNTTEMAELSAFLLFQHVDEAREWAMRWIAANDELAQICGYHVLLRAIKRGDIFNQRNRNALIDQANAIVDDTENASLTLRKAAHNCIIQLEEIHNNVINT